MARPNGAAPLTVLFLVVLIDMIGFTLVIPFLTYFVQDLATGDGFSDIGARDRWVGIVLAPTPLDNSCSPRCSDLSLIGSDDVRY